MKERAADLFPLVLAAVLPLVGLILAVVQFTQGDRHQAGRLALASAIGLLVYLIVLTG